MMGIGHTFFEQMVYEDGQLLNPGLIDYRVPTMADLPEFRSILVENADGPGPYGSKGIGESGLMPTAPAIANAIAQAIGVRLTALPLTPSASGKRCVRPSARRPEPHTVSDLRHNLRQSCANSRYAPGRPSVSCRW